MTALLGKTLLFAGLYSLWPAPGQPAAPADRLSGGVSPDAGGAGPGAGLFPAPCVGFDGQRGGGDPGANGGLFSDLPPAVCRGRPGELGGELDRGSGTGGAASEEADLRLLQEAGDVLGRYDGESQRQALEGLLRGLEGQAAEAAETSRRLCPGLSGAGPCSGAVLPDPPIKLPGIDKLGCA